MKYGKVAEGQYLLRFEIGEEIVATLKAFCIKNAISNASVSGIGSVENPTIAHYRVDTKKYSEKILEGIYEVTSLLGNIGLSEGLPLPHLHITVSDEAMHSFGGHLVQGTVSATLEVSVTNYPTEYSKLPNEAVGLKLYELPETT